MTRYCTPSVFDSDPCVACGQKYNLGVKEVFTCLTCMAESKEQHKVQFVYCKSCYYEPRQAHCLEIAEPDSLKFECTICMNEFAFRTDSEHNKCKNCDLRVCADCLKLHQGTSEKESKSETTGRKRNWHVIFEKDGNKSKQHKRWITYRQALVLAYEENLPLEVVRGPDDNVLPDLTEKERIELFSHKPKLWKECMYKFHLRRQKVKWKGVSSLQSADSDYQDRKSLSHLHFAITGDEGMCNSIMIHQDSQENVDLEVTSEAMPEGKFTELWHKNSNTSLSRIREDQEEGSSEKNRHFSQDGDGDDNSSESTTCSSEMRELSHGIRDRAHKANVTTRAKQRHRHKMMLTDISTPQGPKAVSSRNG